MHRRGAQAYDFGMARFTLVAFEPTWCGGFHMLCAIYERPESGVYPCTYMIAKAQTESSTLLRSQLNCAIWDGHAGVRCLPEGVVELVRARASVLLDIERLRSPSIGSWANGWPTDLTEQGIISRCALV